MVGGEKNFQAGMQMARDAYDQGCKCPGMQMTRDANGQGCKWPGMQMAKGANGQGASFWGIKVQKFSCQVVKHLNEQMAGSKWGEANGRMQMSCTHQTKESIE